MSRARESATRWGREKTLCSPLKMGVLRDRKEAFRPPTCRSIARAVCGMGSVGWVFAATSVGEGEWSVRELGGDRERVDSATMRIEGAAAGRWQGE